MPGQDFFCQRILDPVLDGPPQRSCPVFFIEALVCDLVFHRIPDEQRDVHLLLAAFRQLGEHEPGDLAHVVPVQRMEYHDLVDPVQELRFEHAAHFFHDAALHLLVVLLLIGLGHKAQILRRHDLLGAHVGRHDDDRILKADLPSLGVGDMAVIQHLQ